MLSRTASKKAVEQSLDHNPDQDIEATVSRWLSSNPQLVVWDWDRTVVQCHTFRECIQPEDVVERWKADVYDLALFQHFLRAAQVSGIRVGIASYGRRDVILAYLECIFSVAELSLLAEMIVTPSDFGLPDGTPLPAPGKPKMLACLCERAEPVISDTSTVLFFEDDEVNVDDAHDAGYCMTIFVPDGFSRSGLRAAETGDNFDVGRAGEAFAAAWGHDGNDPALVYAPS